MIKIVGFFQEIITRILNNGTAHTSDVIVKHRIIYFNAILLSLPLVYTVFVLMDVSSYFRPLKSWYFDQLGFFLFVFISSLCFLLNYLNNSRVAKLLFILTWPVIMHIVPIIIQNTPPDYYYAYPMGLIFHSILIQVIFCLKKHPFFFWSVLGLNFLLMLYSIEFLQYFDTDAETAISELAQEKYYSLVIVLYWLLFNLVVFYLMHIIDNNLEKTHQAKHIIEEQKNELEVTLERLKQSQNHLVQSEKLASLGVFTAGISHELNNPINYIASGASGLFSILDSLSDNVLKDKPEYERELKNINTTKEAIESGIHKATSIISSLRNYSHPGGNELISYNCINCIKDSITLLSTLIENRIKVIEDYPDEINVMCNAGKINQAFFNILNNAVQAIANKGEIRIKAYVADNKAVFEIKDTGCGIAPDDIKSIFDPFYTTKEIGKGTGLGLFIVHSIVDEHKGVVKVESKLNVGSVFTIILPLTPAN